MMVVLHTENHLNIYQGLEKRKENCFHGENVLAEGLKFPQKSVVWNKTRTGSVTHDGLFTHPKSA